MCIRDSSAICSTWLSLRPSAEAVVITFDGEFVYDVIVIALDGESVYDAVLSLIHI